MNATRYLCAAVSTKLENLQLATSLQSYQYLARMAFVAQWYPEYVKICDH
jgi:hypothetical protein